VSKAMYDASASCAVHHERICVSIAWVQTGKQVPLHGIKPWEPMKQRIKLIITALTRLHCSGE
jgi:hypothetical protein